MRALAVISLLALVSCAKTVCPSGSAPTWNPANMRCQCVTADNDFLPGFLANEACKDQALPAELTE